MTALPYTPCYCEENIYRLLAETLDPGCPFDSAFAVVVSSFACDPSAEQVNVWDSVVPYRPCRVADLAADLMVWDYHVIAVVGQRGEGAYYVVDFDSNLPRSTKVTHDRWKDVCIDFCLYVRKSFLAVGNAPVTLRGVPLSSVVDQVRFRVLPRADYMCFLRTDRTHMLDTRGMYSSTPPPEETIQDFHPSTTEEAKARYKRTTDDLPLTHRRNNLVSLINTRNALFPGDVLTGTAFLQRFS